MFEPDTITLPILTSLVNMGIKYDVRTIRNEEIVEHLTPFYPDTLEEFDALEESNSLFSDSSSDKDFRLLALARKCEAHILLPLLFFFCATKPLQEIFAASSIVTQEDLRAIIVGRESLMKDANQAEQSTNLEVLGLRGGECFDETCFSHRRDWVEITLTIGLDRSPPFPLLLPPGDSLDRTDDNSYMCKSCQKLNHKQAREIRQRAWDKLPNTFGLGSWDELRKA